MNMQLRTQTSYEALKAAKHHAYKFNRSLVLFFVSGSIFIAFFYIHPCLRILQAWNAAMHNDNALMHTVATKLLRHPHATCQHWGLYYDVLSKVMSKNMNPNDMHALRNIVIKEYFYKNQTIAHEDLAHLFPQYAHKSELRTIDKYMYMLLGYLDFYRMDYHNAVKIYWEILQRYETNDAIRYNYEMSLFFLNYTEINRKESHFKTAVKGENKKILPIPSLIKVHTGNSYYMRQKEKSDNKLPAY